MLCKTCRSDEIVRAEDLWNWDHFFHDLHHYIKIRDNQRRSRWGDGALARIRKKIGALFYNYVQKKALKEPLHASQDNRVADGIFLLSYHSVSVLIPNSTLA